MLLFRGMLSPWCHHRHRLYDIAQTQFRSKQVDGGRKDWRCRLSSPVLQDTLCQGGLVTQLQTVLGVRILIKLSGLGDILLVTSLSSKDKKVCTLTRWPWKKKGKTGFLTVTKPDLKTVFSAVVSEDVNSYYDHMHLTLHLSGEVVGYLHNMCKAPGPWVVMSNTCSPSSSTPASFHHPRLCPSTPLLIRWQCYVISTIFYKGNNCLVLFVLSIRQDL